MAQNRVNTDSPINNENMEETDTPVVYNSPINIPQKMWNKIELIENRRLSHRPK